MTIDLVLGSRFNQVRQGELGGVVGSQDVNINDRLESIGRQGSDRGEEVPCSTSNHKIDTSKLFHALFHCRLKAFHFSDIDGANTYY
jgi:hypothetical protein